MITEQKTKALLFDLDGTLIDHFQAIYRCFVYVEEKLGLPVHDYPTIKASVGASLFVTLVDLMGEKNATQALPLFEEYYASIIHEDLILLPGVHWLFNNLLEHNYTIALFTNKPAPYAKIICETLEIDHHFVHFIGSDRSNQIFKKPEKVFTEHALNLVRACPKTAALIGDSTFDIDAATCVNMPVYTVTTGSHSRTDLSNHHNKPTQIFDNLFDLGHSLFKFSPTQPALLQPIPSTSSSTLNVHSNS